MNKAALLIKGVKVMSTLTDARQLPAAKRYCELVKKQTTNSVGTVWAFHAINKAYNKRRKTLRPDAPLLPKGSI